MRRAAPIKPHEHAKRHHEMCGRVEEIGGAGQPGHRHQRLVQAELNVDAEGPFQRQDVVGVGEGGAGPGGAQDQPGQRVGAVEEHDQQEFPPYGRQLPFDGRQARLRAGGHRGEPASVRRGLVIERWRGDLHHTSILCRAHLFVITWTNGLHLSLKSYVPALSAWRRVNSSLNPRPGTAQAPYSAAWTPLEYRLSGMTVLTLVTA